MRCPTPEVYADLTTVEYVGFLAYGALNCQCSAFRRSQAPTTLEVPMAKSRPTIMKRQRELARAEKRRDKAARRASRPASEVSTTSGEEGEDYDPDIAHIVAGPQPIPWADEFDDEQEEEEETEEEAEQQG